ncbi:hypothetical protein AB0467_06935 [Streptomyces sp. NPDC052095]|uniref:hypothetical protein n=1 Tax=unclassified Streptomyces TaxID=2593676 RepID=UPI00344DF3A2
MDDSTLRTSWRYTLPWAELDVFTHDSAPQRLRPVTSVLARLEDRFRPALLRPRRGPEGMYAAAWPSDRPLPEPAGNTEPTLRELRDVVLAEIHSLTCRVCAARFQGVYPDSGMPFFGDHLRAHRSIDGCPTCGNDFTASRIQALALLPIH